MAYKTFLFFQLNWVCDDAWRPAAVNSMFFVGAIVGTIIFGYTADTFGRYWTFIASNTVVLITGLSMFISKYI